MTAYLFTRSARWVFHLAGSEQLRPAHPHPHPHQHQNPLIRISFLIPARIRIRILARAPPLAIADIFHTFFPVLALWPPFAPLVLAPPPLSFVLAKRTCCDFAFSDKLFANSRGQINSTHQYILNKTKGMNTIRYNIANSSIFVSSNEFFSEKIHFVS